MMNTTKQKTKNQRKNKNGREEGVDTGDRVASNADELCCTDGQRKRHSRINRDSSYEKDCHSAGRSGSRSRSRSILGRGRDDRAQFTGALPLSADPANTTQGQTEEDACDGRSDMETDTNMGLSASKRRLSQESEEKSRKRSKGSDRAKKRSLGFTAIKVMKGVSDNLKKILADTSLKRSMREEGLKMIQKYEDLIVGLCEENAFLLDHNVDTEFQILDEKLDEIGDVCTLVKESLKKSNIMSDNTIRAGETPAPRTYAVIVRGEGQGMTQAHIRDQVLEKVSKDVNIRVKSIRPIRDGIAIETRSTRERDQLLSCDGFRKMGMRAEPPRGVSPKMIVYDVPLTISDEELLDELYKKNIGDIIGPEDMQTKVRIIGKNGKKVWQGEEVNNVLIELPIKAREKIVQEKRVYIGWYALKVNNFDKVPRCYRCYRFGHHIKECPNQRLCRRCCEPGHLEAECTRPPNCINCKERAQTSNHSVLAESCPQHKWRADRMRERILQNGR